MKKFFPLLLCLSLAAASVAQVTLTTVPCNHDGLLSGSFTGVTPPLRVAWFTLGVHIDSTVHTGVSGLTDDLTGYGGGPMLVVATDGTGHADTTSYVGHPPFVCTTSVASAVCPAFDTITAVVSGGTAPYSYQWFNVASMTIVGSSATTTLPQGTYGLTITDAHGCVYGSLDDGSITTTLVEIAPFSANVTTTTAACTNGTAAAAPVGGGLSPFTYVWSNGAGTSTITGLIMGNYNVTITDADGCAAYGGGYVNQSIAISAPVTPTPATCTNANGAVIAFGAGGLTPYSYVWSNGATTQSQTGLHAGNYQVTVTDANGCIGYGSGIVGTSTPISVTYSSTSSLCTGPTGTSTVFPVGGTLPYSIEWYTTPVQTTATATALMPGDYYFVVTDNVGCTRSGYTHVPPIDVMSIGYYVTSPVCTLANGAINLYPSGGVAPYRYSWSTGATTSSVSGLHTGGYSVTITDALSCSVTKEYGLISNSPVGVGIDVTPESCMFSNDGALTAVPWGGTPPYTYSWTGGGTTSTISGLPLGYYWVSVADAHGCAAWDSTHMTYDTVSSCYCTIAGRVYFDANHNCVHDPGEPGVPHVQVGISGRGYTYTDDSGYYSMPVPSGTYTVTETVEAFYPLSSCQLNHIPVTVVAATACFDSVNFANSIDTIHDMHITMWDFYGSQPVIGHPYTQVVIISNQGTVIEDSVFASYKSDGQLLAPSFNPSGVFSGSSYYYTGAPDTINPGFSKTYYVTYNVPTNIPLNTAVVFQDTVAYKAPLTNWLTDYTPWNNVRYLTSVVTGSFDPNFKEVNPQGTGPEGLIPYTDSVLEYMVHFQNTGTAPAENIVVIDTLDANVNWVTLSPEYMSAKCQVMLQQSGSYKVATFTFSDINLPTESADTLGSNGMLMYTVHLLPGLPAGTQIHNKASIYFDYNAPVRTNTTVNTLSSSAPPSQVTAVQQAGYNSFKIYPNPAATGFDMAINSAFAGSAAFTVCDITGKVLMQENIDLQGGAQVVHADASLLTPGIYFVTLAQKGTVQTQKLVILK